MTFTLKAGESLGDIELELRAQGNGESATYQRKITIRPPAPLVTQVGSGVFSAEKPAKFSMPRNYLQSTTQFKLTISAIPTLRFGASLQYLLIYPHGCIEQTSSKLFPLLYFQDLAKAVEPAMAGSGSVDYYLSEGISKIESMQLSNGKFSYWPHGDYCYDWASIYAAHFLAEAHQKGYPVSERVLKRMISALKEMSSNFQISNSRSELSNCVYSQYVLAIAGEADRSMLNYLRNNHLKQMDLYSQFQLAGAYAASGDLAAAKALLPLTINYPNSDSESDYFSVFNLNTSRLAMILNALNSIDPNHPEIPKLMEALSKEISLGRWSSTIENALALLAMGKMLSNQQENNEFKGKITIAGQEKGAFDHLAPLRLSHSDWIGADVKIDMTGNGKCYYYWSAEGIPSTPWLDDYDRDLKIRRQYLNQTGSPIYHNTFKQGELIIAKITLESPYDDLENVAVVDLLPACFEIENPRLNSRGDFEWLAENYSPAYLDIRDDRLMFYGNFNEKQQYTFYYGIRVVTAGEFTLPPISAEVMYQPGKSSLYGSGRITVSAD